MIRVLVGNEQAIFRAGLTKILAEAAGLLVVAEAATGEEIVQRATSTHAQVVVLDVPMPGRGGLRTIAELKQRAPGVKVLVLTAQVETIVAVRCLRGGADGFLTKDAAPERLVAAIRKVAAGGKYVSPALAERLAASLELDAGRPAHEKLSQRELQVLNRIGAGRTVSEIAAELALSVKTVSTYRSRVLDKLGMKTTAEIIRYVIATGLET